MDGQTDGWRSGVSTRQPSWERRESEAGWPWGARPRPFHAPSAPPRGARRSPGGLPFKTRSPGRSPARGRFRRKKEAAPPSSPAVPPGLPGPPAATMSASAVFILDVKGKVKLGAGVGARQVGLHSPGPMGGPPLPARKSQCPGGRGNAPPPTEEPGSSPAATVRQPRPGGRGLRLSEP